VSAASDPSRSGILLVDKPQGMTSHDVVSRTRKAAGTRKVGHAGTLDPMATGLLLLGVNSATRLLTYLVGLDKEYLATIRLGASTVTDDAEGEVTAVAPVEQVDALIPLDIDRAVGDLTGVIQQVPSTVSAIKVDGKRAYARARAGEQVELAARTVTIPAFEVLQNALVADFGSDGPRQFWDVSVRVACSSGTYVRALARDLGSALGVGGHLTSLRRTRVGPFSVTDAAQLDDLDVDGALLRPAEVAARLFPVLNLSPRQTTDLEHGRRLRRDAVVGFDGVEGPVAAVAGDGRLVGLVEPIGAEFKVLVNFPVDQPR
jgi:tRNA pseudouridine55 synthase